MTLLDDVIDAHGGLDRWEEADGLAVELAARGLAFTSKGHRSSLRSVRARVATHGQHVELHTPRWAETFADDIPTPRGIFWSNRDLASFTAAALWTYVSLPFVLPGLEVTDDDNRLIVEFPPELRTHSPRQVLHIGTDGLITRHDYTALAFGRWAHASQEVTGYRSFDGLTIATKRRVRPHHWPHRPQLVSIDITSVEIIEHRADVSRTG